MTAMLVCFFLWILARREGGRKCVCGDEKAWKTVSAYGEEVKSAGASGGKEGLEAAPAAKITMRAFLGPVEVWRAKVEESGSQSIDWTIEFCTMLERL